MPKKQTSSRVSSAGECVKAKRSWQRVTPECRDCGSIENKAPDRAKCRSCYAADYRKRYAANPELFRRRSRAYAQDNRDAHLERKRLHYKQNEASERARRKLYRKPESGKRGYECIGPRETKIRRCHAAVRHALATGKLTRQPCQVCGTARASAHHDDYDHPLDVRWLCAPHHREWHRLNGPGRIGDVSNVPLHNIRHSKPKKAA